MFGAKCLERSALRCINFLPVISELRDSTAPAARNSVVMHLFDRLRSVNRHLKGVYVYFTLTASLIFVEWIWTSVVDNAPPILIVQIVYLMFIELCVKHVAYSHDISVASTWLG